ncbi:MAG TPA: zinc-ribbon and DUF3426 domain-containing protein [Burkholderiaceae bacterium]
MSLATRCPVCQTVFRVVQDQLKVSEGWVRCGRCAKVFNAFEGLFDLEREFPALRSPTPSQRVLEDLAGRNRQPKPSDWPGDFDAGSSTRVVSQPTSPAANRMASGATVPHVSIPRAPAAAPNPTPPKVPPVPTPQVAASPPPSIGALPRESAPLVARTPRAPVATDPDDGATIPPVGAVAAARLAARDEADREATVIGPSKPAVAPVDAPVAAPPSVAAAAPATPPAPARSAARADAEIKIRDEPAPVPGSADEADRPDPEQSFEALFRSGGDLAEPVTGPDDLDIVLDSDVEPAALDDAVDSRLLTFVQQADRAERWRRPGVRAAMVVAALVLAAVLAAQLLVAQRDTVVAQWPRMRSLVQSLCAPLDCRIEPLRRIDQLGVDSSGLTRIDDGPVYRLALVLRNRSDMPLLMPSIDLSLSDAAGVLVSRRVLTASDLGTVRNTIGAGQELPLQALLMSAERPLTGYTIEIFYP